MLVLLLALMGQVDWPKIKTNENIRLLYNTNDWEAPERLPDTVNSEGWEDSAEINWEGNRLVFFYSRVDLGLERETRKAPAGGVPSGGQLRLHTPPRPEYPDLNDGTQYQSDILISNMDATGKWTTSRPAGDKVNTNFGMEGCAHITVDGKSMFFSRSWTGTDGRSHRALFRSDWSPLLKIWGVPNKLPPTINNIDTTRNTADNPFLSGNRFYWEQRGATSMDIFSVAWPLVSRFPPPGAKLVPGINKPDADDTQLWVAPDGKQMLFCRDHAVLFTYKPGDMAPYGIIATDAIRNAPYAGAIGEPSMDYAGNLYFVYIYRVLDQASGQYWHDADIVRMKPKKKPS